MNQPTVSRILNEHLHAFRIQKIQALQASDYPMRVECCQWFLVVCGLHSDFPDYVLFTDDATFTDGHIYNVHNTHVGLLMLCITLMLKYHEFHMHSKNSSTLCFENLRVLRFPRTNISYHSNSIFYAIICFWKRFY